MWIVDKTYCSEDNRVFKCVRSDALIDLNKARTWENGFGRYRSVGKTNVYLTFKDGKILEGEYETNNGVSEWVIPLHPVDINLRECDVETVIIDLSKG